MRLFTSTTPPLVVGAAPVLIEAGMITLIAHACWPIFPAATALAFIALGATLATIARSLGRANARSAIALHLIAYAGLYLILLGAISDAAMRGPLGRLTWLQRVDFSVSAVVMMVALQMCIAAITARQDAQVR